MMRAMIDVRAYKTLRLLALLFALMAGLLSSVHHAAAASQLIDLGTLGGTYSEASAINDRGDIVGTAQDSAGQYHGVIWQHGVMSVLAVPEAIRFVPADINNAGQIVGYIETASGSIHAALWDHGVLTDLGVLGGDYSHATAINERGQIVGVSATNDGPFHAFLWERGVMTDLGSLNGEESRANDINNRGLVVGASGDYESTAVLWQNGAIVNLGGNTAVAINDRGQIVGQVYPHAALWDHGELTLFDGLPGSIQGNAVDINNRGQIAGDSFFDNAVVHATLWDNGTIIDLGTLGGSYAYVSAINNAGQVVGRSETANGEQHAFVSSR